MRTILSVSMIFALIGMAYAHDGWVQSNVPRAAQGDMVYIDMQFGNHGNTHRDYKIWASKWDKEKAVFTLYTPRGEMIDLTESVMDLGVDEAKAFCGGATTYIDKNGYLSASFLAREKGIYIVDGRQDLVVSYAPERSIKCAKAIVGAVLSRRVNRIKPLRGYDSILGQELEVVPLNDPTGLAVGDTLSVQVLFKGVPLPDAHISFIPRGRELPPFGVENPYDVMTDMGGIASFTFDEANYHLIVMHVYTSESGELDGKAYAQTKYAASLTVIVNP